MMQNGATHAMCEVKLKFRFSVTCWDFVSMLQRRQSFELSLRISGCFFFEFLLISLQLYPQTLTSLIELILSQAESCTADYCLFPPAAKKSLLKLVLFWRGGEVCVCSSLMVFIQKENPLRWFVVTFSSSWPQRGATTCRWTVGTAVFLQQRRKSTKHIKNPNSGSTHVIVSAAKDQNDQQTVKSCGI